MLAMEPEQKITNVVQKFAQSITVKLKRNARGQYQWEVEVADSSADGALYTIDYLDDQLRSRYIPVEIKMEVKGKDANDKCS
jgi:hypothetical protein